MLYEITKHDREYLVVLKQEIEWHQERIDQMEEYANEVLVCESELEEEKVMDYFLNSFPDSLDEFLDKNEISVREE